jgi:hypothetical protein
MTYLCFVQCANKTHVEINTKLRKAMCQQNTIEFFLNLRKTAVPAISLYSNQTARYY